MLPENKKVNRDVTQGLKIWVYGKPNIGKTTFAKLLAKYIVAKQKNSDGSPDPKDEECIAVDDETGILDSLNVFLSRARLFFCRGF